MPELECRCKHVLSTSELRNYGGMLGFFALFACCDLGLSDGKRNCTAGLIKETKPRHGGFTYPGSEDDRCPMHQDGGKIFLCSEQTNVAHPTLALAAVDRDFPASHRDAACRCT